MTTHLTDTFNHILAMASKLEAPHPREVNVLHCAGQTSAGRHLFVVEVKFQNGSDKLRGFGLTVEEAFARCEGALVTHLQAEADRASFRAGELRSAAEPVNQP